ncbi:MAG: LytTR family DNA-binding domain-containing protein [Bacteroidota bacterium]
MKKVITSVIVDDEHPSRETLRLLIQKYCSAIKVVAVADSAETAKEAIEQYKPQVVFLDIQMPGGSGLDLLDSFDEINFDIIFTTAYHQYAVKAFRMAAIDYLLKPIDIEELQEAVQKVQSKFKPFTKSNYEVFKQEYTQQQTLDKLMIPTQEGYVFVKIEDIIYVEAHNNYTQFHFTNKKSQIVCRSLAEYEELLESFFFHRIHHKYMINLKLIELFNSRENYVKMVDSTILYISTRKKGDFLNRFKPVV